MSGRWGDRPLGRGGWRVLQSEAGPNLPHVLLRSRAAERDTGANRPKPFYSGSRNQLPITVTILRSPLLRVDSPAGSFSSVLPAAPYRLLLVPMYLRKFFAPPFESSVPHCVPAHNDPDHQAFERRHNRAWHRSRKSKSVDLPMQQKRRSGRIAKEIAIVLLGTDTTGKVLSEETKTVVLSRHGAGIVSRYRFSPDERLTLSLPGSAKEAEIRLVGQIGGEPGRYIYGVAFVDPDLSFWPVDFPGPESVESHNPQLLLECSLCQARQNIDRHEIEEDVYSVNGYILRHCAECGTSTPWKKAEGEVLSAAVASPSKASEASLEFGFGVVPSPAASPAKTNLAAPPPSPAPRTWMTDANSPEALFDESFEPALGAPRTPASTEPVSSYSGSSTISEFASLSDVQLAGIPVSSTISTSIALLQAPEPVIARPATHVAHPAATPQDVPARKLDANGRPINKRRHVRIRVSFSACVRHPAHADEVVECENVSKSGACFHSLKQYKLDSLIEVAAPFSPGETALFVPARIKRVEALSGGQVFRYGVEYMKSSPTAS